MTEVWPGTPFPLGSTWDGEGTNFSLFSENAERVELCLFEGDTETRIPMTERDSFNWHCYCRASGPGSATATGSTGRTSPRPGCASTRRSSSSTPTHARSTATSTTARRTSSRTSPTRATTRTSPPTTRTTPTRYRSASWSTSRSTGRATARCVCLERDDHLRGAHEGLHEADGARARGPPRHVRRLASAEAIEYLTSLGVTAVELLPIHHIADEGYLADKRPPNYWGYSSIGFFAPHVTLRRDGRQGRAGARVQGDGEGAPPRRDRGDPRRRLQPHRRGQPPRADALVPRHRQPVVLPARRRDAALLHGLHRHGQQPQPGPPERAPADHGLAPLLRDRVPRRRLPLRPRVRARARVPRGRPPLGVLRRDPPGPGALAGEADRRAVGCRRRRLPGRQLPGALDGVERHLPRRRPRLLARRGERRRLRLPLRGLRRPLREGRPQAVRLDQLHHRARRLHAQRPRLLQREAQRGERREQQRRRERQPLVELRRRGPDRRPGDQRAPRAPDAELHDDAPALAGRADDRRGRRDRTHAGRQQQRLLPGQRDLLDRLEPRRAPGAAARVHEAADPPPAGAPRLPPLELPRRRRYRPGAPRRVVVPAGRAQDDEARLGRRQRAAPRRVPQRLAARDTSRAASPSPTRPSSSSSTRTTRRRPLRCPPGASARGGRSS